MCRGIPFNFSISLFSCFSSFFFPGGSCIRRCCVVFCELGIIIIYRSIQDLCLCRVRPAAGKGRRNGFGLVLRFSLDLGLFGRPE